MSDNRDFLSSYIPLVDGLQRFLGEMYEIILHDTSRPASSIVHIAGNLTGRATGGPLTNVVIEELKRHGNDAQNMIGYRSQGPNGRLFKSATIFLHDSNGQIRGCFCINMDVTLLQADFEIIQSILAPTGITNREVFARDITEVVDQIVNDEIAAVGIPTAKMTRAERTSLIQRLDEKGVFEVKGAVERIANLFDSSIYTIYSYLKEIRHDE